MKQIVPGIVAMAVVLSAQAGTKTWVAELAEGETEASAAVAANWDPAGIPAATDDIVLDGDRSNVPLVWTVAATGDSAPTNVASWTQRSTYTARVTMPTKRTGAFTVFTVTGDATLDGGSWWRSGNTKDDGSTAKVWLNVQVNGDLTVGSGFTFNGYAAGFAKAKGPSSGGEKGSTGGAHGGLGGGGTYGHGTVYGDYRNPDTLGSGAYACNDGGGGAVLLDVGGDFVLDGTVSADGGNGGTSSGTSGGSVWIRARTMSGSGTVTANGGSPSNKRAGGGAGRISIQLSNPAWTQSTFATNFTGTIRAIGGLDSKSGSYVRVPGASGTVYIETAGDNGKGVMRLTNRTRGSLPAHNAVTMIASGVTWDISRLDMTVNGRVGVAAGGTLSVPNFDAITGDGSSECLFAFIGGEVLSNVKYDKLVADGFHVAAYATTDFGDYHLEIPAGSTLTVADGQELTVGELTIGGNKLAKGTHSAETLAGTYANIAGTGTIVVVGLTPETIILLR